MLLNIKYVERWLDYFWIFGHVLIESKNKTRQACHIRIEIINNGNVQLFYKRVKIVLINFTDNNATQNNTTNCG